MSLAHPLAITLTLALLGPGESSVPAGKIAPNGGSAGQFQRSIKDGRPVAVLEFEGGYAMSRSYDQAEGPPFYHSVSLGASAHAGWSHRRLHYSIGAGVNLLQGRGESGVGWPSRVEPITHLFIPIDWRFGVLLRRTFLYTSMGGAIGWSFKSEYETGERRRVFKTQPILVGLGGMAPICRSRVVLGLRGQTELYNMIDSYLGSMVLNIQATVGVLFFGSDRPTRRASAQPRGRRR